MLDIEPLKVLQDNVEEAINRLLGVLTGERCKKQLSISDILDCHCSEHSFVYIAKDTSKQGSEQLVGMGFIFFKKTYSHWLAQIGWIAEIHDIAVDKACQGKGIGTNLVKALIAKAQEFATLKKTSILLSLTSRPKRNTHDFYCGLGFELVGKAHGENGTNYYRMTIAP